jgi:RNA-directed DNA polymerase
MDVYVGESSAINAKPFKIDKKLVFAAWRRVKANGGAAGIDGQTIEQFEVRLQDNLYCLWNRMSSGSYFPDATRSVSIPKASGGKRILGIPTVRDRIAQTVVKMLLEPELEQVFDDNSFGGRPKRSAHQAIAYTRKRCWEFDWVVEFDIKAMFDCIDQNLLMAALRHHKPTKWVLLYTERWLKAPIVDEHGDMSSRTKGVPQGGPLSPLLANLFLHYGFDAWMRRQFPRLPFCRYIDDGLVHCRSLEEARLVLRFLERRMHECGLSIHPTKTSIVYCKDAERKEDHETIEFTFLGYSFRPRRSIRRGRIFVRFLPAISPDAEADIRSQIRKWKLKSQSHLSMQEIARRGRPMIQGWMNYFGVFYRSQLRRLAAYINSKLVKWAMCKYKHLKGQRAKAEIWMEEIRRSSPRLFAHWDVAGARMAV